MMPPPLSKGKLSEAEPLFVQTVEILKKSAGPNHPHVATAMNNLGGLLKTMVSMESEGRRQKERGQCIGL